MLGPTRMLMDPWWLGPLAWAFLCVYDYALACAALAVHHYRLARRHDASRLKAA